MYPKTGRDFVCFPPAACFLFESVTFTHVRTGDV